MSIAYSDQFDELALQVLAGIKHDQVKLTDSCRGRRSLPDVYHVHTGVLEPG
jgi:hypothetical protein